MKKYIFLLFALITACYSCIDSHDEFPDLEHAAKPHMFSLSIENYNFSNDIVSFKAQVSTSINLDFWDLKISTVEYYVDGEYYTSSNTQPYSIYYQTDKWTYGEGHELKARIMIDNPNGNPFTIEISKSINVMHNGVSGEPEQNYNFDLWVDTNYATTGDVFKMEAIITDEMTSNVNLKSITFRWDDEEIVLTKAPYVFTRKITELPGTEHYVSAEAVYTVGNSTQKHTYSYIYSKYKIYGATDVVYNYSLKSYSREFKRNQTLKGRAKAFVGEDRKNENYGFVLYLDGVKIEESKSFPFDHEYPLSDLSIGKHVLQPTFVTYDENWRLLRSVSTKEEFEITE